MAHRAQASVPGSSGGIPHGGPRFTIVSRCTVPRHGSERNLFAVRARCTVLALGHRRQARSIAEGPLGTGVCERIFLVGFTEETNRALEFLSPSRTSGTEEACLARVALRQASHVGERTTLTWHGKSGIRQAEMPHWTLISCDTVSWVGDRGSKTTKMPF